jgi:predicted phage terminase large subunit-like protein
MNQITIRPTKKQREAAKIAGGNFITLYGGAVRGGKSYWLILLIFSFALKHPKSRWVIMRANYTTLKSTLLVTFHKLISEGLGDDIAKFNQQDMVVTLVNGSQIIFFAENYDNDKELNRFRGLEVNGFGIDEINEIQEETFNKCIERAGSWQGSPGCPIKILATCNPADNWVKDKFYDRWEGGRLPEGWAYVPSKITDNPHISNDYIESLKQLPEHEYDVFVNGNWNAKVEGVLFNRFELRYFHPSQTLTQSFESSIAYADIADEGEDSTAVPIGRNAGKDIYITDVLFSKLISDVTIPLLSEKLKQNDVRYIRVESNAMGAMYARNLAKEVPDNCQVLTARATTNKHTRILMDAGFIKKYCVFLAEEHQSDEYRAFMRELCGYLKDGKSKHDDAPDALTGLAMFVRNMLSCYD